MGSGKRGNARYVVADRCAPDRFFIVERFTTQGRVDYQIDLACFHQVHNVRPSFVHFEYRLGLDSGGFQRGRSSPSSKQMKTQRRKLFSKNSQMLFVTVVHAEKNRALARQALPRRKLGFRERLSVRCRNPHDFARRAHLGAENSVDATKLVEGKHRRFHEKKFGTGISATPLCRTTGSCMDASFFPVISRAAAFASGTPVALLTNGTVRDARG